jgi:RNA polymerase sigma-70 factor (ECF subfamily)
MQRTVNEARVAIEEFTRASEPPASGEAVAWAEIVRTVHAHMRAIVGPSRDLEDLAQSALEQVVRAMPRFEGRAQLSTYTYRICAHVAMNHWRWWSRWLRRFRVGTADLPESAYSREEEPPALSVERERARRLHQALDQLAPKKRLIVVLADFEGLAAPRIGEILQCPEPTVRSRLRQARLELSALLHADPYFAEVEAEVPR